MSKITDAEANATSLDGLVNDNALVPTLRNGPKPSYQYLVDGWNTEFNTLIDNLDTQGDAAIVAINEDVATVDTLKNSATSLINSDVTTVDNAVTVALSSINASKVTVDNAAANVDATIAELDSKYKLTAIGVDGAWQSGIDFTAYNQYLVFSGTAYQPKPETSLPYTTGATPDLDDVQPVAPNTADNIFVANGGTVQDQLDGREFDTVADAIAFTKIDKLSGNRVYLKDRQAYFEVVASITITPNDIDQILSTANTSFGFRLPASAEISTTNLGCTGEQSQSVADRFERGGELINSVGGGTLKINNGRHTIERTTFIPVGVYLKGDSATFNRGTTAEPDFNKSAVLYPLDTGIYIENYLFFLNIDINNPESWVTQFPNKGSGGVSNLSIDAATSNVGYNGFKFGGSHKFEELRCRGVGTLIGKPVGLYTDAVSIKQIHASYRKNTTDYLLDIPGLGDAYVIEDIASGYIDNQSGITKNLNLGTCRSGHVTGLINGISTFNNTSGVTISAGHLEGGYYELVNSEVIVSGNVFFTEVDNAQSGVLVNNSDAFLNKWVSVIKDNQFTRVPNRRGGWGNSERADITFANASSMAILENNYRTTSISGEIATKSTFGIIIDMNGNLDNAFNKYSEHLSISKVKVSGGKAHLSHSFGSFNKNYGGFGANSSVVNIDQDSFKEATGTYYYQCQVLLDADRLIGRTVINSEISIDVVSQDDIPVLYLDKSAFEDFSGVKLRVYRGTSSGQYSNYVDIPIVNSGKLYDDGESLSGFPWKAMVVGGMLSLNNNGLSKRFKIFDNNIEIHTDAAKPSAGTWVSGDRVVRDTITPVLVGDPITTEYLRLSNGSAHAGRVDWLALNMLEA